VSTSVLLRGQAEVMEGDVNAVHTAFVAALGDGDGEKAKRLLLEDIDAASRRIKDCFGLLLMVVVEKISGEG
jgi:DNA-binding GntR family transcriptional regulator